MIMGSANLSYNAFGGIQRENICCIDGAEAYDWYMSQYEELKENSTDVISHKALTTADLGENLDALPISETVKVKKALVIEPTTADTEEDVQFILDVHRVAKELLPSMPKRDKKAGKILLAPEVITRIRRQRIEEAIRKRNNAVLIPSW